MCSITNDHDVVFSPDSSLGRGLAASLSGSSQPIDTHKFALRPMNIAHTTTIVPTSAFASNMNRSSSVATLARVVIYERSSSACLFDRMWDTWKGETTHNSICALVQFFNQFARSMDKSGTCLIYYRVCI